MSQEKLIDISENNEYINLSKLEINDKPSLKITDLPNDILLLIFEFLPPGSLMAMAGVNKHLRYLVTSDSLVGRNRLAIFLSHHITKYVISLSMDQIREVGIVSDNSQFIRELIKSMNASINDPSSTPSNPDIIPVLKIIKSALSNPNDFNKIFPIESLPKKVADQFQTIHRIEDKKKAIQNALIQIESHQDEISREINRALRREYIFNEIKEKCTNATPIILRVGMPSVLLTLVILAIIYGPKRPLDPNKPNFDDWDFDFKKYISEQALTTAIRHITLNMLSNPGWMQKYGDLTLLATVGAQTAVSATVAAVTASAVATSTTAATIGGGVTTVALASNPVGWIVSASLLGTFLIGASIEFAWNYSADGTRSLNDLCRLARKGKVQKILTKYEPSFDVNCTSSMASCGIAEIRLGKYSPLALAVAYGNFTTVILLIEYYHANPNLRVGTKNNLTSLDIAKQKYTFFPNQSERNKIINYLRRFETKRDLSDERSGINILSPNG